MGTTKDTPTVDEILESFLTNCTLATIEFDYDKLKSKYTKKATEALDAHYQQKYKKIMLETITTNQKGQFEDDAGDICWYLDDLIKAVTQVLDSKGGEDESN